MREVDKLMVESYGIQMIENAGRNLAVLTRRLLGGNTCHRKIVVACSKRNNGGGGLVAARHLANWGAEVTILLGSEVLSGVPAIQLEIVRKMNLTIKVAQDALEFTGSFKQGLVSDFVIDALIGYGLSGSPRGWTGAMINGINAIKTGVLSLDVPSGLDATTGEAYHRCVRANATMTLALPKQASFATEKH